MSKVSTLVNCSDAEAIECLNDFIESIQMEMSVGGAIPFTIPTEPIAQIVKNAKTMFYKMYEDASEEMFIAIPQKEIERKTFSKGIEKMKGEKEENKGYRTEQFLIKKGHPLNKYLSYH